MLKLSVSIFRVSVEGLKLVILSADFLLNLEGALMIMLLPCCRLLALSARMRYDFSQIMEIGASFQKNSCSFGSSANKEDKSI